MKGLPGVFPFTTSLELAFQLVPGVQLDNAGRLLILLR